MIKNLALIGIFINCFAPAVFIIFRLFPSMVFIENISYAENIFHLKDFGTWLPVAMCVAGVHGSMSVHMHAYALAYWDAWRVWTVHVLFFSHIYSVLFVQIFNTCALAPNCPCLRSYYGFCAIFIIVEGPLDICSLFAYLVVHYLTKSCCNCACFF